MKSTTFFLMIVTLISKITGLIREQFFAYYLGTGMLMDVYSSATSIPYIVFSFVIVGVTSSFIPIYNKIQHEEGKKRADYFTANITNILFILASLVIIVLYIFAGPVVKIFAKGYDGVKFDLTVKSVRLLLLTLYPAAISSVYIGYLQVNNDFKTPSITGIFMNIIIILFLVLAFKLNNFFVIMFGVIIADFVKYIFFPRAVRKTGYKHHMTLNLKEPYLEQMLKMSLPMILSVAALDISSIIDKRLASELFKNVHGAVSALNYAYLVLTLVSGVIIVSIVTSIYPSLSKYANQKRMGKLKQTLVSSISSALIIIIPATVGLMVLSQPVIRLLLQRGQFNADSTLLTSGALFFYAPALIGFTVRDITTRGFFALGDSLIPVKITIIQVIIDVFFNLTLSKYMGINGLALSTSIAALTSGFLTLLAFRKKYGSLKSRYLIATVSKVTIASLIMGIVTYLTYNMILPFSFILALFGSIFISLLVYIILILFMKIPEVKLAVIHLSEKFNK